MRELNAVNARVPLIPTNQSLSERQTAALAKRLKFRAGAQMRKAVANRIAGVIDWSQRRSLGFCADRELHNVTENQFALASGVARINQRWSTSARFINFFSKRRRPSVRSIGFRLQIRRG